MRIHTKPKKVIVDKTLELEFSLHDIPALSDRWLQLKKDGWQLFVVEQNRGMCYSNKKWITIPLWVISKPKGQWVYYVAHEFAHTPEHTWKGLQDPHGSAFMEELKRLCPAEFLHYELGYKKSQAINAGIDTSHKHKATDIKVKDLWDIL